MFGRLARSSACRFSSGSIRMAFVGGLSVSRRGFDRDPGLDQASRNMLRSRSAGDSMTQHTRRLATRASPAAALAASITALTLFGVFWRAVRLLTAARRSRSVSRSMAPSSPTSLAKTSAEFLSASTRTHRSMLASAAYRRPQSRRRLSSARPQAAGQPADGAIEVEVLKRFAGRDERGRQQPTPGLNRKPAQLRRLTDDEIRNRPPPVRDVAAASSLSGSAAEAGSTRNL